MIDKIVVFCTHEYEWLLWPFSAMLWKYWPRRINVLYFGNKQVDRLPRMVEFRQVPMVTGRERNEWDWLTEFGAGVASALRTLDDDVVMISCADMWLCETALVHNIDALEDYLLCRPNVLRVLVGYDVGTLCKGYGVESYHGMEIRTIPRSDINRGMLAGFLLWPSLWNRSMLLDLIIDRSSIWDFEELHTVNMPPDVSSVWVNELIMYRYAHVLFREHNSRVDMRQLMGNDVTYLKSLLPDRIEVLEDRCSRS